MAPGRELCGADAETVATTQAFLRDCLDVAATVGAGAIAGPIYTSTGRTWRITPDERVKLYAELRENLAPVADYAGEVGVKIGIEPLVRYETSLINTVEQALEAIDPLPCPWVAARHLPRERGRKGLRRVLPPRRPSPRARPRLRERSRSPRRRPHRLDRLPRRDPRHGLRRPGRHRSFTAENETIATAASVWRPLAASQDAIAVDGLAFLRELFASATAARTSLRGSGGVSVVAPPQARPHRLSCSGIV